MCGRNWSDGSGHALKSVIRKLLPARELLNTHLPGKRRSAKISNPLTINRGVVPVSNDQWARGVVKAAAKPG